MACDTARRHKRRQATLWVAQRRGGTLKRARHIDGWWKQVRTAVVGHHAQGGGRAGGAKRLPRRKCERRKRVAQDRTANGRAVAPRRIDEVALRVAPLRAGAPSR